MQLFLKSSFVAITTICLLGLSCDTSYAQDSNAKSSEQASDEIFVFGKRRTSGNRGMAAFHSGDFKTAEIAFDKHYTSLRRADRAVENAASDGAASSITTQIARGLPQTSTLGVGADASFPLISVNSASFSNGASVQANPSLTNLVNDGKVTYKDFAFSKYMSGLSQIQLGKLNEAKKSLQESVDHYGKNYDARMRLGLLELRDGNYIAAREQLIELDKIRKKCGTKCKDSEDIQDATLSLAKALSAKA